MSSHTEKKKECREPVEKLQDTFQKVENLSRNFKTIFKMSRICQVNFIYLI